MDDVREVPFEQPWVWLTRGWRDLTRAPAASLCYGMVFVVAGYGLTLGLIQINLVYLVLPVAAGFMFLGPLIAVGLYDISRQIEHGKSPSLGSALRVWRHNATQITLMGIVLALFALAWIRVATLIFALFFTEAAPTLDDLVLQTLFSETSLPFLLVGTAAGAVLAAMVFAVSAVSVPMLLDRPDVDVITAVLTSIAAVRRNWKTMWGWACLIVLFAGAGLVTFYIGLAITLPLIGHASWHAYRDLIANPGNQAVPPVLEH